MARADQLIRKQTLIVSMVLDDISNGNLRLDYPCQRRAKQWSRAEMSQLIETILHGEDLDTLKVAEMAADGTQYLIDGLQRMTAIRSYVNNEFRLTETIRPIVEIGSEEIDITGKYYKELPESFQTAIQRYNLDLIIHPNCTREDVEYHIQRYNISHPMKSGQTLLCQVGSMLAAQIKNIAETNPFVQDHCAVTPAKLRASDDARMVLEAVMMCNHLADWQKKPADLADYAYDNIMDAEISAISALMESLAEALPDGLTVTLGEAPYWVALYQRYAELENPKHDFSSFVQAWQVGQYTEYPINGQTWEEVAKRNSKDKTVVMAKLAWMTAAMEKYMGVTAPAAPVQEEAEVENSHADSKAKLETNIAEVETAQPETAMDLYEQIEASALLPEDADKQTMDACLSQVAGEKDTYEESDVLKLFERTERANDLLELVGVDEVPAERYPEILKIAGDSTILDPVTEIQALLA